MDNRDNIYLLGNMFIKHIDKWRGDYYLKSDLTFTVDKSQAIRVYLLKSGDTTIINGDRVSLNSGNKSIIVDESDTIKLIDRDQSHRGVKNFLVINGTENTDPITYETPVFLVTDKARKTALKYEWGMDLVNTDNTSALGAVNYKPHNHPKLINGDYGATCESYINTFKFYLERADGPITNLDTSRNVIIDNSQQQANQVTMARKNSSEVLDGYKGAIMVVLLMIVLILCIIAMK